MKLLLKLEAQVDKLLPGKMKELALKTRGLSEEAKKLSGVTKETTEKLNGLKKAEAEAIKKNQNLTNSYKTTKKQLGNTIVEYRKNREELKRLQQAKNTGQKLTKVEERRYKALTSSMEKMTKNIDKQRSSFQRYKQELQKQKIPFDQLQKEIKETEERLKKLNAQQLINNKISGFKKSAGNFAGRTIRGGINLAKKAVVGGAAIGTMAAGYVGVQSAKSYLDFHSNMKRVQAISGATSKEFKMLEKEAIKLGATTKFTAGESAAAMEKMALAGFDYKQIMAGMPGILNLAAAAGEDVAMVSDIITDNLVAFNMEAKDTGRFADVLAWGMSKTNVNVEMLGESFKFAAGSASNLGVSLEEMVGSLGLMGDQAIKSGMAGRGMDAMFSKLATQSDKLAKINENGINGIKVKNKDGSFVGIVKIVEQFEQVTEKMGDVDKVAFLENVFGKQGERAFSKLLSAQKVIDGITYKGSQAVAKTIEAAEKDSVGMAEKMKDIMMEGASGAWTLFTSAWDGFKVSVGEKIFSKTTLRIIKKITDYISEFSNVLNGSFSNSYYNIFWQKFFISTKAFVQRFKTALQPAIDVMKRLLPDSYEAGKMMDSFIKTLGDKIIKIVEIFSWLMQGIEPIINFIKFVGIDNVLVFIAAFAGMSKVISILGKVKAAFSFIQSAGGIFSVIKMGILALGSPIAWIAAAIILIGYLIYKKFDKIKERFIRFCQICTDIKNFFVGIGLEIYNGLIKPVIDGFVMAFTWFMNKLVEIGDFIGNIFAKVNNLAKEYSGIFNILIPSKMIFDGIKAFWKAWDSNKSITENLKNGFLAVFDSVRNNIAKTIESFTKLGEKIKNIPFIKSILTKLNIKEVQEVDGSHKAGLPYVPYDSYIAELHKGERVLTAEENREYEGSLYSSLFKSKNKGSTYNNNSNSSKYEVNYSPQISIKIEGNGDESKIASIISEELAKAKKEFEKMMENLLKERDEMYADIKRAEY